MELIFTDRFLDRLEEFSDYIALDNVPQAITWAENIFSSFRKLQKNPNIGRIVPEFRRPEIRELIHKPTASRKKREFIKDSLPGAYLYRDV